MTKQLMDKLLDFRTNAKPRIMGQIFGPHLRDWAWGEFKKCEYDVVKFYGLLDSPNARAFGAWLSSQANPAIYTEPVCAECGEPLTADDVAAGETCCLDCGAAFLAGAEQVGDVYEFEIGEAGELVNTWQGLAEWNGRQAIRPAELPLCSECGRHHGGKCW